MYSAGLDNIPCRFCRLLDAGMIKAAISWQSGQAVATVATGAEKASHLTIMRNKGEGLLSLWPPLPLGCVRICRLHGLATLV